MCSRVNPYHCIIQALKSNPMPLYNSGSNASPQNSKPIPLYNSGSNISPQNSKPNNTKKNKKTCMYVY